MVETAALAGPALDVGEELGDGALRRSGWGGPVGARPGPEPNHAARRWPLDEKQHLGLPLPATDEQLQGVARGRVVEVERRHLTSRRSATIAPKSNARYSNENLYNDHAAGIH